MIFDESVDEKNELLKNTQRFGLELKTRLKLKITVKKMITEKITYFPLNKPIKFHAMIIIIRSIFEEDGKLYPQIFLDDTLYES